ncbi:hypothetical protein, partial [Nostoc sp. FACHB-133]|uniref:hypothetical protein n=1 Tax=Nostoc sp. FACHB-133 TaxID=2692835 RepID=UPI001A7EC14A
ATSTYLVNKVTSYLDFIFAIACFLLDLTKPHCSRQLLTSRVFALAKISSTAQSLQNRNFEIAALTIFGQTLQTEDSGKCITNPCVVRI